MLPWVRHRIYEFCIKMHVALGISAIVIIWFHLKNRFQLDGYLLIGSVGLFVLNIAAQLIHLVYRNGRGLAVAKKTDLDGAVRLTFTPTRPWKVRAGQYIYLKIPAVSHFSFAESHPFNVMWWEDDAENKASTITVLAKVESGFTRRLGSCSHKSLRVIIDGPYGNLKDMDRYDSFVFISTGIGVTAQLAYLKELITKKREYPLRRVCLVWQAEEKGI